MKPRLKTALIIALILALAGTGTGLYLFYKGSADLSRTRPDFIMTATDLQKEFETDETEASSKYINRIIEVSGKIASVKKGENNYLSVSFETGSAISSVIGTFPGVTGTDVLSPGETITFRGQCSGFLLDVLLNNCSVISKE